MSWSKIQEIKVRRFDCGHCDSSVASDRGYQREYPIRRHGINGSATDYIYVCPNCHRPNYFHDNGTQVPMVRPGEAVGSLPDDINRLYNEARDCCTVGAFTASVLASRKLLMNIGVSKGATEGLKFIEYVNYLENNHYTPPNSRDWVDHIRSKGNEATHEIALMSADDANELIVLVEMLLKFIYEFPNRVPKKPT